MSNIISIESTKHKSLKVRIYPNQNQEILINKADTFFPSSQLCNVCGFRNHETKNLQIRSWICPVCGTQHNRDTNAVINLKNYIPRKARESKSVKSLEGLVEFALQNPEDLKKQKIEKVTFSTNPLSL